MSALRTLLAESIDYAGLFPPAQLDMEAAVRNFAAYRAGPDAWALGRFVVPATRLGEFEQAAGGLLPPGGESPWRLAALIPADTDGDFSAVLDFNRRHSDPGTTGAAVVDVVELKAAKPAEVTGAANRLPDGMAAYLELPANRDPGPALDEIKRLGLRAKIRTGGVTPDAFPTAADVVRFLRGCAERRLGFKATAGLHHPLRGAYRLTYEPGSASAPMYGYLNLFLADAFLRAGLSEADAARLVEEGDATAFRFGADGVEWRGHRLSEADLARARREGMAAFGSCSFTEPLDDARALGLLARSA